MYEDEDGMYMSFRRNSPFVDIVFYNKGLYTIINMKKGTLKDPNNLTKTFFGKGHWGNGNYYLTITQSIDLDEVIYLIKQSYKSQE